MTVVIETNEYKVEGSYEERGAIQEYIFVRTDFTGSNAEMNSGQYNSEVHTVFVLPNRAILVIENDTMNNDQDIDWDEFEPEWTEGYDENIAEVYTKFVA